MSPSADGGCLAFALRSPPGTKKALRRSLGLDFEFDWLSVGRFEVPKDYPNMLTHSLGSWEQQPDEVLLLVG